MKRFTTADVQEFGGALPNAGFLQVNYPEDLAYSPLDWQKQGLQETASGYGAKLTSEYKVHFEGKLRRLYVTQCSNAGSHWFTVKGKKIFVD